MSGSRMEHRGRTARQRWAEYGGYGLGWEASLDGTKYLGWELGRWHLCRDGWRKASRVGQRSSHSTQTMTRNLCVSLFSTFLVASASWYFTIMFIPITTFWICLLHSVNPGSEERKIQVAFLNPGQGTLDCNQKMILTVMETFSSLLHRPMK